MRLDWLGLIAPLSLSANRQLPGSETGKLTKKINRNVCMICDFSLSTDPENGGFSIITTTTIAIAISSSHDNDGYTHTHSVFSAKLERRAAKTHRTTLDERA